MEKNSVDIVDKLLNAKYFHTYYEEAANEIIKLRAKLSSSPPASDSITTELIEAHAEFMSSLVEIAVIGKEQVSGGTMIYYDKKSLDKIPPNTKLYAFKTED